MLRLPLAALFALVVLLAGGPACFDWLAANARAQEAARPLGAQLTARGRMLVSGRVVGFWSDDTPQYYGANNTWSLRADPALTYFVRNNLGLGVALSFGWSKGGLFPTGVYRSRGFALGGEFVWSAKLAPRWRLLMRPFLGYARVFSSSRGIEIELDEGAQTLIFDAENTANYVRFATSLPIVYALNENIGVGLAPEVWLDLLVAQTHSSGLRGTPEGAGSSFLFSSARSRYQLGLSLGLYASF